MLYEHEENNDPDVRRKLHYVIRECSSEYMRKAYGFLLHKGTKEVMHAGTFTIRSCGSVFHILGSTVQDTVWTQFEEDDIVAVAMEEAYAAAGDAVLVGPDWELHFDMRRIAVDSFVHHMTEAAVFASPSNDMMPATAVDLLTMAVRLGGKVTYQGCGKYKCKPIRIVRILQGLSHLLILPAGPVRTYIVAIQHLDRFVVHRITTGKGITHLKLFDPEDPDNVEHVFRIEKLSKTAVSAARKIYDKGTEIPEARQACRTLLEGVRYNT